jgi:hypothetical protein
MRLLIAASYGVFSMLNLKQTQIAPRVFGLLTVVGTWAEQHPSVTAVALAGSHGHGRARSDSDIDLVILADAPDPLRDSQWLEAFGKVKDCTTEQWGIPTAHRVNYEEHGEVEIGVAPSSWADLPVDPGTERVVADGIVVVSDTHRKLEKLITAVRIRNAV